MSPSIIMSNQCQLLSYLSFFALSFSHKSSLPPSPSQYNPCLQNVVTERIRMQYRQKDIKTQHIKHEQIQIN